MSHVFTKKVMRVFAVTFTVVFVGLTTLVSAQYSSANEEYEDQNHDCTTGLESEKERQDCYSFHQGDDHREWIQDPAACADGIDNDEDGVMDEQDPGCASEEDNDEYNETKQPVITDVVLHEQRTPVITKPHQAVHTVLHNVTKINDKNSNHHENSNKNVSINKNEVTVIPTITNENNNDNNNLNEVKTGEVHVETGDVNVETGEVNIWVR